MNAPTFKPSDVVLTTPPLGGTMRKTEIETAAGLVVFALAHAGDTWRPLPALELAAVLETAIAQQCEEPLKSWARNPFMRPDFRGLIDAGFAVETGEAGAKVLELTDRAFEVMKRWVRP